MCCLFKKDIMLIIMLVFFFFQAEDGIRDDLVTGVQTCALPISLGKRGADLLAQVPLFEGLSRRHLKQIAEHADEISFRERETIVEAGEPGGSFFVIVEGEVSVVGGDRTIARAGTGE